MKLSLIICTRDRCRQFAQCLHAVRQIASSAPWELIVVDNGSSDATAAVVEEYAATSPVPVRYVFEPRPGLGIAHNAGVRIAQGEILAFTDDDCYPATDFVDQVCRSFGRDRSIGYISGRIMLHDRADHPITVNESLTPRRFPGGSFIQTGDVQGANMAFRKGALLSIGGFDPLFGPGAWFNAEDVDAAGRASAVGWNGQYRPEVVVRHHHGRKACEAPRMAKSYAIGRGAYHMKLLLKGGEFLWFVRSILGLRRRYKLSRGTLLWEQVGAAKYLYSVLRRASAPAAQRPAAQSPNAKCPDAPVPLVSEQDRMTLLTDERLVRAGGWEAFMRRASAPEYDFGRLPDLMGWANPPRNRRPRLMTPVVGPLRRSFSGISWHMAKAAISESVIDAAFALSAGKDNKPNLRLQVAGALWKAQRILQGRRYGGFKYHSVFNDVVWSQHLPALAGTVIINNTQIFGRYFIRHHRRLNVTPCFYIDGTLSEYFHSYGAVNDSVVCGIDADFIQQSIKLEREGYACAERIVTMSRATARNLVEVYGVPPDRISIVMPGANIEDAAAPPPSPHRGWLGSEFTLGFVGLYPLRKGLDKLAAAVSILRSRAIPVQLRVIGRCPEEIAAMDGVEYLGTIDKATDTAAFVKAIQSVDLGCQLSRAELTGIAMLEFLRVGVPILATSIGGMPDVIEGGGGVLVPADITAEQLAEELHALISDSVRYDELRQSAVRRAEWASWRRAAHELGAALAGVD